MPTSTGSPPPGPRNLAAGLLQGHGEAGPVLATSAPGRPGAPPGWVGPGRMHRIPNSVSVWMSDRAPTLRGSPASAPSAHPRHAPAALPTAGARSGRVSLSPQ